MPVTHQPTCPECGAPLVDGLTCWEQLGALLAWEYDDPELQAQHFLTVASYNLQHPAQFTEEALAGLRGSSLVYLGNGMTIQEVRRRAASAYDGKKRVLRDEAERRPILRSWRTTIADVYLPGRPQGAAIRVKAWAEGIRNDI